MTTTVFNAKEPLCHGRRVARPTGRPVPRPRVSFVIGFSSMRTACDDFLS